MSHLLFFTYGGIDIKANVYYILDVAHAHRADERAGVDVVRRTVLLKWATESLCDRYLKMRPGIVLQLVIVKPEVSNIWKIDDSMQFGPVIPVMDLTDALVGEKVIFHTSLAYCKNNRKVMVPLNCATRAVCHSGVKQILRSVYDCRG